MCGIAGMWGAPDQNVVLAMTEAMSSRGPDAHGLYENGPVVLGHRRLSILDLSSAGKQPMSYADEKLWITYNGEIYNFQELRAELEAKGKRFISNTDTEVILALYEAHGAAMVNRLRGIFAFAILDLRRDAQLFLARDHMGIKPLLYVDLGERFLFASECRALLKTGLVNDALDTRAVMHCLIQGNVVQPRTLFKNIRALPPGHTMTISASGRRVERFWDLDYQRSKALSAGMDYRDMVAVYRTKLEHAVRSQMISDVPLGAFLSGGVDSSTLVALMRRVLNQEVQTYTVSFSHEDNTINESDIAERSAKALGANHHTEFISDDKIRDDLPEIIARMDQPSLDNAQAYLVSRPASKGLTVALSGLGADELLAGYSSLWGTLDHYWQPSVLSKQGLLSMVSATGLWKVLPDSSFRDRWEETAMRRDLPHLFGLWHNVVPPSIMAEVMGVPQSPDLYDFALNEDDTQLPSPTARLVRLLTKIWLPSRCLRDCDVGGMAHSLEVRVPFLDVDLVEFSYALPDEAKWGPLDPGQKSRGKRILIDAVRDILPEWTYNQPKRGFFMPFDRWLRGGLRPLAEDTFASASFRQRGLFSPTEVDRIWNRFLKGELRWAPVWILLWIELFLQSLDHKTQV